MGRSGTSPAIEAEDLFVRVRGVDLPVMITGMRLRINSTGRCAPVQAVLAVMKQGM